MRILSTSAFALASVFLISPALSADIIGSNDPTSSESAPRTAFQGVGIGVHGGGQFTNIDINDQFDGIGADGLIGGLHAEYLFVVGNFRAGIYADGGISNVNTEAAGFGDIVNQDWYAGGGIKGGIVVYGSTLIYGKLGYEWSKWSIAEDAADADVESAVIGGGVETMVAQNVSVGLEANYVVPLSVEVEGDDLTDYLEESESIRALARITYRH